ncbi:MAG: PHP domain-containing protein [Chloroflexota bacterium]|nr:PHP domain-containing protein [Chloroflexota bacterium]
MEGLVDLHLHTLASDGRLSPTELVNLIASKGVTVAAISDHDTTDGIAEAVQAASAHQNLEIIPAIELSTDIPGDEIHMLGYFLDYEDEDFQGILRHFREGRLERGRMMVEKLAALGKPVEWERVKAFAGDGSVGRPHIALAMVEAGYFKEPKEAFYEYLGRNGLAYAEREKMTPEEGVEMLAKVGGSAVLAHPAGLEDLDTKVAQLKEAGLVGMEVHYAMYSEETIQRLLEIANRHGLIPCGGSDYHGLGNTGEQEPGLLGPPVDSVQMLMENSRSIVRKR